MRFDQKLLWGVRRHSALVRRRRVSTLMLCVMATGLASGAVQGCASNGMRSEQVIQPRGAILIVSNNTPDDQPVFLLRGSTEIPLGSVGSFTTRVFVLAAAHVSEAEEYRLTAHKWGLPGGLVSNPFGLRRGNTVHWTVDALHFISADVHPALLP